MFTFVVQCDFLLLENGMMTSFGDKSLFLAGCCAQDSYQRCHHDITLLRALQVSLHVPSFVLVLLDGWGVQMYYEREHDPKL